MNDKRVLTIQDISCVGQCSLTVALPIISACGLETAILPSAVLSNHTGGFKSWTFRDLTDDMPDIEKKWVEEEIALCDKLRFIPITLTDSNNNITNEGIALVSSMVPANS